MFGVGKKALEDEKRILEANRPQVQEAQEEPIAPEQIRLEKGDLKAMVLAVLSLTLPYLLVFIASIFLIYKVIQWIW